MCLESPAFKRGEYVKNFGTTEHVETQDIVFESIHRACRVGGFMIHSVPLFKYWIGHSPYSYSLSFPNSISEINKYDVVVLEEKQRRNQKLLNFVFRKLTDDGFIYTDTGVIFSPNYKKNSDNLF